MICIGQYVSFTRGKQLKVALNVYAEITGRQRVFEED
jgi:hypothetical protein